MSDYPFCLSHSQIDWIFFIEKYLPDISLSLSLSYFLSLTHTFTYTHLVPTYTHTHTHTHSFLLSFSLSLSLSLFLSLYHCLAIYHSLTHALSLFLYIYLSDFFSLSLSHTLAFFLFYLIPSLFMKRKKVVFACNVDAIILLLVEYRILILWCCCFYNKTWNKLISLNLGSKIYQTFLQKGSQHLRSNKFILNTWHQLFRVNFTNVIRTAFSTRDPKSAKRHWWLDCLFVFLESLPLKAACKHVE